DGSRVAFLTDHGKGAATQADKGALETLDLATGRTATFPRKAGMQVFDFALSPDGRKVAIRYQDDPKNKAGVARVWDTATGEPVGPWIPVGVWEGNLFFTRQQSTPIGTMAFSPDGRRLASTANDGAARIWDPASGRPDGRALPHNGSV